jgi:hypothetical protein
MATVGRRGNAEVTEQNHPIGTHQHIFRLDIPVDHPSVEFGIDRDAATSCLMLTPPAKPHDSAPFPPSSTS